MRFTEEHLRVIENMERRIARLESTQGDLRGKVGDLLRLSKTHNIVGIEMGEYGGPAHRFLTVKGLVYLIVDYLGVAVRHTEAATTLEKLEEVT